MTQSFFQYLVDGDCLFNPDSSIHSLSELRTGVDRFRQIALLIFGNVKYAFKTLSRDAEQLDYWVTSLRPIGEDRFTKRHRPLQPIEAIESEKTYYLGYIVKGELEKRLQNPNDEEAQREESTRRSIVEIGTRNHHAYLACDHLDVYVATSMRQRHEFGDVNRFVTALFSEDRLKPLNLRYFDPTQAYCENRIDKGLAEALMLKRARCTVYLAQEADTLGKDSELASTLAQGKPVIAYVPKVQEDDAVGLLDRLQTTYPDKSRNAIILEQLQLYAPKLAWNDQEIRQFCSAPDAMDTARATAKLESLMRSHYEGRAATLRDSHPLGIQVNLTTGVANGVLVVRTVGDCAELIRRILTNNLVFSLDVRSGYLFLREEVSNCIFRVVTGDAMLTNSFWNYYLEPTT